MATTKTSVERLHDKFMEKTKEILALSVNENSPYKESLKFLNEKLDDYAIPDTQKVQVLAQLLPNMTIAFTTTAMQTALALLETAERAHNISIQTMHDILIYDTKKKEVEAGVALKEAQIRDINENIQVRISQKANLDKDLQIKNEQLSELQEQRPVKLANLQKQGLALDANIEGINEQTEGQKIQNATNAEQRPYKLEQLKKQVLLLTAQIEKVEKEAVLCENQKNAIRDQVFDNRLIKSLQVIGSFISEIQSNGLNVPEDMTKFLFTMISELVKKAGINMTMPKSYAMTKPK